MGITECFDLFGEMKQLPTTEVFLSELNPFNPPFEGLFQNPKEIPTSGLAPIRNQVKIKLGGERRQGIMLRRLRGGWRQWRIVFSEYVLPRRPFSRLLFLASLPLPSG